MVNDVVRPIKVSFDEVWITSFSFTNMSSCYKKGKGGFVLGDGAGERGGQEAGG